jgi:ferric-dicitrate binding protein FerR (iron transport regulator)
MTQTSFHDVQQLSALLDEKLNPADAARLQTRLESDSELRTAYEELRQTRTLLRSLPQRRAPRNFTLKPSAARVRPPLPRLFPTFRLASVLASLLLFFSLATNATLPRLAYMASEAPMYAYGMGGGPDTAAERAISEDTAQEMPMLAAEPEELADPAAPAAPAPMAVEEPVEKIDEEPAEAESLPQDAATQPYHTEIYPEPAPLSPPIPAWALISLALLALLSGSLAFFLRWKTEQRWQATHKQ